MRDNNYKAWLAMADSIGAINAGIAMAPDHFQLPLGCLAPQPLARFRDSRGVVKAMPVAFYGGCYQVPELRNPTGEVIFGRCGTCERCQAARRGKIIARTVTDATLYGDNATFLTLTMDGDYSPDYLVREVLLFTKRAKQRSIERLLDPFHFVKSFEFGSQFGKPHCHMGLFGIDPEDLVLGLSSAEEIDAMRHHARFAFKKTGRLHTQPVYMDEDMAFTGHSWPLWGHGRFTAAYLKQEDAPYIAKYATKDVATADGDKWPGRSCTWSTGVHGGKLLGLPGAKAWADSTVYLDRIRSPYVIGPDGLKVPIFGTVKDRLTDYLYDQGRSFGWNDEPERFIDGADLLAQLASVSDALSTSERARLRNVRMEKIKAFSGVAV